MDVASVLEREFVSKCNGGDIGIWSIGAGGDDGSTNNLDGRNVLEVVAVLLFTAVVAEFAIKVEGVMRQEVLGEEFRGGSKWGATGGISDCNKKVLSFI